MSGDQLAIGAIVVIACFGIWLAFRDNYTDLKEHPPEQMPHGLRIGATWDKEAKTVTIGQNLTLTAGIVGKREPTEEQQAEDAVFAEALERRFGDRIEPQFYQTVAGVSHLNRDRTRRSTVIKRCAPMEILHLVREPDNPFDANAVAVLRSDGSQLGYLPWRAAAELNKELSDPDCDLVGIFRHHNRHPETGRIVGAVVLIASLKPAI